jgi:hypothetical protein
MTVCKGPSKGSPTLLPNAKRNLLHRKYLCNNLNLAQRGLPQPNPQLPADHGIYRQGAFCVFRIFRGKQSLSFFLSLLSLFAASASFGGRSGILSGNHWEDGGWKRHEKSQGNVCQGNGKKPF